MIRALIDSALNSRFLVVVGAVLLLAWGAISFHNLPVEAYPDVANNYVQVITQWPGHAAEEVEQQVTIPVEIVMNGIPHLDHLRSFSVFGLSSLMLIFDDESTNDWNRQKVLERLSQVSLPGGLQPQIGSDFSPVGQIYWYTLRSTNPRYDVMDLKSLEDWTLEKQFKSVPNVVDVVVRRGHARISGEVESRQAGLLRLEHRTGGATTRQQQRQRGRQLSGGGLQQINVRALGLIRDAGNIERIAVKTQNGASIRIGDIATVTQGPNPPGPHRQSLPSRRRQGGRQRRRDRRHRASAEGRGVRCHAGGHPRQSERS